MQRAGLVKIRNEWLLNNPQYLKNSSEEFNIKSFSNAKVLVLAPHPDDEIIGCGGTLLKLASVGAQITVVYVADGASSAGLYELPEIQRKVIRLQHAREVSVEAGFNDILFWNEPSSHLECLSQRVEDLKNILDRVSPDLVFIPFVKDKHPDHTVLNAILYKALRIASVDAQKTLVLNYEVWSLAPNNVYCDITEQMKKKEKLLFKYPTEMRIDDYVHSCEALHFYNSTRLAKKKWICRSFFCGKCQ